MDKAAKCYLCGSTENLTRDHIPPASYFPKPRPKNLITVDCCERCNNGLSLDDEAFRAWVCAVRKSSDAGKKIYERVSKTTFKRSPGLLATFARSRSIEMLETQGTVVPIHAVGFSVDRANRVLVRFTKGLLTTFYPAYDYSEDSFEVFRPKPIREDLEKVRGLAECCLRDSRGEGVFDFWHNAASGTFGCWIYAFYNEAVFVVKHRKPKSPTLPPVVL
jgi:hypothetical protein